MKEIERVIDTAGILLTKDALEAGISKHLLYSFIKENGFEQVFRRESGIGTSQNYSENKIIELAIHHKSKPGLALSVVEFAERNGGKTIPELFQNMFSRLVSMAKTRG